MAVHVEDHPIEYFDFEGVIPAKQYGAGDVIVWDWGTWEPEAPTLDGRKSVDDGELKFRLNGEKLKGRFTIVRTSGRGGSRAVRGRRRRPVAAHPQADEHAVTGWDAEDHPQSVKTGPDERRGQGEPRRHLDQPGAGGRRRDRPRRREARADARRRSSRCSRPSPSKPFDDDDWLFEIKWDGFRVQAVVDDGKTRILTRNLNDAATYFPRLLGTPSRWIEARAGDRRWRGRRPRRRRPARLQPPPDEARRQGGDRPRVPGLRPALPRRSIAARRPARGPQAPAPERAQGPSPGPLRVARRRGGEGVLRGRRRNSASRAWSRSSGARDTSRAAGPGPGSRSRSGPSRSSWSVAGPRGVATPATSVRWRSACTRATSCGSPARSAAASRARSGKDLLKRLKPLVQDDPPFDPAPPKDYRGRWGGDLRDITWVRPEIVIRAEIGGWTRDGQVRQTAYKGIEAGRDPRDGRQGDRGRHDHRGPRSRGRRTRTRTTERHRRRRCHRSRSPRSPPSRRSRHEGARRRRSTATPEFDGPTAAELDALDDLGKEGVWTIGGRELKLTNLDKPLFDGRARRQRRQAEPPITKRELIRFYASIAPTMLPHLWRSAAQPPSIPERRRRARASGRRTSPRRRRSG